MADDIRQRLYRVLNWANRRVAGYENPCRWEGNLENEINREHVEANHAALDFDKVGGFLAGLRAKDTSDLRMRLALEWNVISQTRAGEAAGTDWSEIDAANDCWAIPPERMKMRRRHRVPLTARHHEILDLILDGAPQPVRGPVFSLDGKNPVSVTGLRKMMQAVAAPGVTLHGFRSAFATWARSETYEVILPGSGERRRIRLYDEAMIEESLAHVVGGKVRTAYVRDDFLELRRPLQEAWAAYCGVVQAAKVVPIRRAIKVAA
jgi:integrase